MSSLVISYATVTVVVALLSWFMPARRFEKRKRAFMGLLLLIGLTNSIVTKASALTVVHIPVSLACDVLMIYVALDMRGMRRSTAYVGLVVSSLMSIAFTLMLLTVGEQVKLLNLLDFAYVTNLTYIMQLIMVAFLSFEYMFYKNGWCGYQPVNYFTIARENNERKSAGQGCGSGPTAWGQSLHHHRGWPRSGGQP